MSQYFEVHPDNPQPRLLKQASQILHDGGIAAIPTDSSYALVCHLDGSEHEGPSWNASSGLSASLRLLRAHDNFSPRRKAIRTDMKP